MKLLKYHNDLNKLKLGNFTERELDVFFSIIYKAKEKNQDRVHIPFSEMKELINEKKNPKRIIDYSRSVSRKLKAITQEIQLENGDYKIFNPFGSITISPTREVIEVPIDEDFKYILNDLFEQYTRFELTQIVGLKSSYSKNIYKLLKQWESTKVYRISMIDFREILNIPEKYEQYNINQKILKPCLEELKIHFPSLKIEKIKKGVKIDSLKFTWEAKTILKEVEGKKQGLTAEDYQKLYPEEKVETIITEEKSAVDLALIDLRKKAQGQAKSKLTQSRYFEFHARVIPLKSEKEIEELCREFGFLLNEELFTE